MRIFLTLILASFFLIDSPLPAKSDEALPKQITIVYANEWPPISAGDDNDVKGILPDLMEEIIHKGMDIKVVHKGLPWARAQEVVTRGAADAFITTPTDDRLSFSQPSQETVLHVPFRAFTRKNSMAEMRLKLETPLTRMTDARFCDVLGNGWAKYFFQKRNITYQETPSIDNCLKMLKNNRTDIVIHAVPVTLLFIKQLKLTNHITQIPFTYTESPEFPLLLSNESSFDRDFLDKFDLVLSKLKKSGDYALLIKELTEKNVSLF